MFGRSKQTTTAPLDGPSGPGKNKPTPKRREAEAARRQPLVPTARGKGAGRGGKASGKAAREAARLERMKARQLMMAGDERYLPARDKGPARRYMRDVVDSRWSLGEFLLPMMLVILLVNFAGSSLGSRFVVLTASVFAFTYAIVLLSALDAFLLARRVKKQVVAKFGADAWTRGSAMYVVMRTYQIRRTRIPKPMVKRGETPA